MSDAIEVIVDQALQDLASADDLDALDAAARRHTGPTSPLAFAVRDVATLPVDQRKSHNTAIDWARARIQKATLARHWELSAQRDEELRAGLGRVLLEAWCSEHRIKSLEWAQLDPNSQQMWQRLAWAVVDGMRDAR